MKLATILTQALLMSSAILLSGCGGDGSNSDLSNPVFTGIPNDNPALSRDELLTWQEGLFFDKSAYADLCAQPRSGLNPFNSNLPYPDQQGTVADENFFLRSWTNELYLWYDEVTDRDPNLYTTAEYFEVLKTEELTPNGRPKDNFHFSQNTQEYLQSTVAGVSFGYGIRLAVFSVSPPRDFRVADVVPGSPAEAAGVERGMSFVAIDGVDFVSGGDVATLNDGLFPDEVGEEHVFRLQAVDAAEPVDFALTSANVTAVPVKDVSVVSTATGDVGYVHFNSHIRPSEADLFDAFTQLEAEGITDLVLDIRYNGGGLLAIAGQVSYMAAGAANTDDKTFYLLQFNDQHPERDPVTGATLSPIPFSNTSLGFSPELGAGVALPALNLDRVFVLTTGATCSASEAIMNGLAGAGVEVIQIGETTCGKPYGFYPRDNCGTTYFSVQFTGVNDLDFGEYPEGFSPANQPNAPGVSLPGCVVEDDFSRALGDPQEGLFAAALQYREDGSCPAVSSQFAAKVDARAQGQKVSPGAVTLRPQPGLENAILQFQ